MHKSILSTLLALLASQVQAAPKGGGKGGSGGGGSRGGSGSSSSCTISNPCNSELEFMYGFRYTSLYANTELYAQAIIYGVYFLVLIGFYLCLRKAKALAIRLATLSFIVFCIFDCQVWVNYWRGMLLLFIAVASQLDLGKLPKTAAVIGIILYSIFSTHTYIVRDFLVSKQAVDHFKKEKEWWLSDRDFGLTFDPNMIKKFRITARGGEDGLSPFYLRDRMFDVGADDFLQDRANVIKIGLTADYLALAVTGLLVAMAALRFVRRKNNFLPNTVLILIVAFGLKITSFFRVIVATHYVLHNWDVVTSVKEWADWINSYGSLNTTTGIVPPAGFLNGYRVTVTGFPIVQAILEPIGVVAACVLVIHVVGKKRKGLAVNHTEPKA